MNRQVQQLTEIASKEERLIIGLMSGTSLDGLDMALCRIHAHGYDTRVEVLHFETHPYNDAFRQAVKTVFAKRQADLEQLCLLHPWIAIQHAAYINSFLERSGYTREQVDLVASHGQTIYHAPQRLHGHSGYGNATLQIGDGDHLAVNTGIITISDFRQKHIAAGGEGAPLALYGDRLLFSKKGEDRLLLNIGGIANFTYLPGNRDTRQMISTDTGPGNTIMDAFIQQQQTGNYFDRDAAMASQGSINEDLLQALKDHPFFDLPLPKTTGPELFNLEYLEDARHRSGTLSISDADVMATLNRFSADGIIAAIKKHAPASAATRLYSSGGGMHNPLLIQHLKSALPQVKFETTAALGIDPDAKEAVLFALLANECVAGDATLFGSGEVSMGKVSFPA